MNYLRKTIVYGLIGLESLIGCSLYQANVSLYKFEGTKQERKIAEGLLEKVINHREKNNKDKKITREDIKRIVYRAADTKDPTWYITIDEAKELAEKELPNQQYSHSN